MMRKTGPEKALSARIPWELYERLREASVKNEVPMTGILVAALTEYLDRLDS